MSKKLLWITDPWESIDHATETSTRLMQECVHQKVPTFWCSYRDIFVQYGKTVIRAVQILNSKKELDSEVFQFGPERFYRGSDFFQIHYRVDPPIDDRYRTPLILLNLDESPPIVNPLKHLLMGTEKAEGLKIQKLAPKTIISSDCSQIQEFMNSVGSDFVIKPLFFFQSKGVIRVTLKSHSDAYIEATREHLMALTLNQTTPIVVQEFLPGIEDGELRLWFSGYELISHIRKMPLKNDFLVNIDAGSALHETHLFSHESKTSQLISKHLKKEKILLAAVDLVDGKITDFNYTSPGLIVEMENIIGENLAKKIIKNLLK